MKSERIFRIPYWGIVHGIRARHRNDELIMIRDEVPVAFETMDASDAPVRLTASVKREGKLVQSMELRHDGKSYLRHVKEGKAQITDADLAVFADTFGRDMPHEDLPDEWLYAGHHKLADDNRIMRHYREPETLERLADLALRETISCNPEERRAEVIRTCSKYALVDGVLHRRVPAPKWEAPYGTPQIESGELVVGGRPGGRSDEGGNIVPVWPIRLAAMAAAHSDRRPNIVCTADAPLENDADRDCLEIAQLMLPYMNGALHEALHELSDDGLDHFKAFRDSYDACMAGDPAAAYRAMDHLEAMVEGPVRGETKSHFMLGRLARPHLARWRAIVAALHPDLKAENEAIDALASL